MNSPECINIATDLSGILDGVVLHQNYFVIACSNRCWAFYCSYTSACLYCVYLHDHPLRPFFNGTLHSAIVRIRLFCTGMSASVVGCMAEQLKFPMAGSELQPAGQLSRLVE